ncbi:unnamed protein product [Nezara viridula]|uniref:Sulfotransferase domain-containing protein n=1 Tax=Nezara viridula TaxID=85310 RepID=A0A9P0MTV4_NEZVI|nr:unnamed protein product [Nezara viridula]
MAEWLYTDLGSALGIYFCFIPQPLKYFYNVIRAARHPRGRNNASTTLHHYLAIIIGVRKCGTRALLEMLYLHPGVQKAAGEVHFFDRDDNYKRGLEWYRKKMPHSFRGQVTIEKSPSYFVTPEVPERIRAMNASVKLLLIVREPVTRAVSDYTQLRSHATTSPPSPPFEKLAIRPDGSVNAGYRPLALSLYHNFMHRWLEV